MSTMSSISLQCDEICSSCAASGCESCIECLMSVSVNDQVVKVKGLTREILEANDG